MGTGDRVIILLLGIVVGGVGVSALFFAWTCFQTFWTAKY